jgi:hypothetical protein
VVLLYCAYQLGVSDGTFYDGFSKLVRCSLSRATWLSMDGGAARCFDALQATGHRHTVAQQLGARPDSGT